MLTLVIFVLMLLDYIFTKAGMQGQFITEGNGIMNWLMLLPFEVGFPVRIIMSILFCIPIYIAYEKRLKIYKVACSVVIPYLSIVMSMHFYWISVVVRGY